MTDSDDTMKVRIGGFARLDRADEDESKAIRDETVELEEGDAIHTDGSASLTVVDEER